MILRITKLVAGWILLYKKQKIDSIQRCTGSGLAGSVGRECCACFALVPSSRSPSLSYDPKLEGELGSLKDESGEIN